VALVLVFIAMVGGDGGSKVGTEKELMGKQRKSTKTIMSI
jgi:hypothetical protein